MWHSATPAHQGDFPQELLGMLLRKSADLDRMTPKTRRVLHLDINAIRRRLGLAGHGTDA